LSRAIDKCEIRQRLTSNFAKSANMMKFYFFLLNFNIHIQTQNLMLILNPLKSCKKNHEKKVINENVTDK